MGDVYTDFISNAVSFQENAKFFILPNHPILFSVNVTVQLGLSTKYDIMNIIIIVSL